MPLNPVYVQGTMPSLLLTGTSNLGVVASGVGGTRIFEFPHGSFGAPGDDAYRVGVRVFGGSISSGAMIAQEVTEVAINSEGGGTVRITTPSETEEMALVFYPYYDLTQA